MHKNIKVRVSTLKLKLVLSWLGTGMMLIFLVLLPLISDFDIALVISIGFEGIEIDIYLKRYDCFQVLTVQHGHFDSADDDICTACSLVGMHLVCYRHPRAAKLPTSSGIG